MTSGKSNILQQDRTRAYIGRSGDFSPTKTLDLNLLALNMYVLIHHKTYLSNERLDQARHVIE